jgi:hypothetical protein
VIFWLGLVLDFLSSQLIELIYLCVVICILGMARIFLVHRMDRDAFLKGNIKSDSDELDLVFERSPTYDKVLEQFRFELD